MKIWKTITTLFILFALLPIALTSQSILDMGIKGEGPVVEEELDIDHFDRLHLSGWLTIHLVQGESQKVVAKGQQNIIDEIKRTVKDDRWKVGFRKNIKSSKGISLFVTMKNIDEISISGSGDIIAKESISTGNLKTKIAGSGNIQLNVKARHITSSISGSGNLHLEGVAESMEVGIAGSGNLQGEELVLDDGVVKISGSGNCLLHVENSLDVKVAGSGRMEYKGTPKINSRLIGSGSLSKL